MKTHGMIRKISGVLGITLYFFALSMFKEIIEKEHKEKEFDEKVHKYGYITIVSFESVENATVLAALTLVTMGSHS